MPGSCGDAVRWRKRFLAPGDLRVRWHEMVVQFALSHDGARCIKRLSEVRCAAQRNVEEGVAEIGPFDLVLAAE